jgi:integrase
MYFHKTVTGRYAFSYYDPVLKRNIRLRKYQHPTFQTDQEAELFCKTWDAKNDALKTRIERRMEWSKKYFDFNNLVEIYENAKKEEAPNSWKEHSDFLRYYVFPFFLTKKGENNLNNWEYHFEEFRNSLQMGEILRKGKGGERKKLAYSTMNNIINSLNGFMRVMRRWKYIENDYKCRHFPSHLRNQGGIEMVIPEDVQKQIHKALLERRPISADIFLVSLKTGMRINEVMGISLADFSTKEIESDFLRNALKPHNLKPRGFINLMSQPALRLGARDASGRVPRKPLKGKKFIHSKFSRMIPIFDKDACNKLVELWNIQRLNFEKKRYGENPQDYLLFDDFTVNKYSSDLRVVQRKLKLNREYSAHCTRHTYCTWLYGRTGGSHSLGRMILGHHDIDMTMRYVHINEELRAQLDCKLQLKASLEMVN